MKTMIRVLLAGSMAVSAAAWADCVPVGPTPGVAAKLAVRTTSDCGELLGLQMVDLRAQRKNDILVVQGELKNGGSRDARVYYRFRWLDDAGMQVGDGEVWKPITIMGKQSQFLKGVAYGPQATDFKIEISAERP